MKVFAREDPSLILNQKLFQKILVQLVGGFGFWKGSQNRTKMLIVPVANFL